MKRYSDSYDAVVLRYRLGVLARKCHRLREAGGTLAEVRELRECLAHRVDECEKLRQEMQYLYAEVQILKADRR
jgi:hypothetical protein